MTRFARAAGSKASNQRVPEDSTPWFVLKQQVTDKKSKEDTHENETDWKNVLDSEKKVEDNKNSVWCEFEEENPKANKTKNVKKNQHSTKSGKQKSAENELISSPLYSKNKKSKSKKVKEETENLGSVNNDSKSDLKIIKSKLNLSSNKSTFQVEEFPQIETDEPSDQNGINTLFVADKFSNDECVNESIPVDSNTSLKRKKRKRKFSDKQSSEPNYNEESNLVGVMNEQEALSISENENTQKTFKKNNTITWQRKNKEEYKRRKSDKGDVKLEINGQEIWVTRLDGFYIKKEDAERIRQLEKDLLKRGVSNQEVRAVIKKERRNAEKALARQKKKVCYHCRKGGHTLSSCPMLEDNGAQVVGSGICYKCGSTEHTHFQCKVNTGNSYKFATCFVCKQEGHISKQCPDNPRGVYPSGGGCRLCGDVTHFRRECPTLQAKSNKVTIGLIDQDIETLDDLSNQPASKEPATKRRNKIVKFS